MAIPTVTMYPATALVEAELVSFEVEGVEAADEELLFPLNETTVGVVVAVEVDVVLAVPLVVPLVSIVA